MYVIRNKTGTYLKHQLDGGMPVEWRTDVNRATMFKTTGAAMNFIQHNYKPFARKYASAPPAGDLAVVPLTVDTEETDKAPAPMGQVTERIRSAIHTDALRQSITDLKETYASLLSYANQEKQDVLHKIELDGHLDAAQRAVLFKRLREILIYRRKCKDNLRYLEEYEATGFVEACARLEKMNREFSEMLESRRYIPRILTELFEKGSEARAG